MSRDMVWARFRIRVKVRVPFSLDPRPVRAPCRQRAAPWSLVAMLGVGLKVRVRC